MSETARPLSIVPAPPQVFGRWVKRQVLAGLALTACLIGFFVVRLGLRERSPMEEFDGWCVWVAGAPAAGSYGTPDAVALAPGGSPLDVESTVMPHMVRWDQNATGPAATTTWASLTLNVEESRGLVRRKKVAIGSFALLGETRTIDGVVWQEAWRMTPSPISPQPLLRRTSVPEGNWRLEGSTDMPALLRLDRHGNAHVVPEPATDSADTWHGSWSSADGVIRIDEHPGLHQRRRGLSSRFVIGRLAADGRSFAGFETSGAAVIGTRIE